MAQCRSNSKVKDSLRVRGCASGGKDDSGCDTSPEEPLGDSLLPDTDGEDTSPNRARSTSTIKLRSKSRADSQTLPDVGSTGSSPTTHSIMKTKQSKDDLEKSNDDEATIEPKTRQARKKFSGVTDEDKKGLQYDPKTSKEPKKILKPKAVVKKRPLGVRKTLIGKKLVGTVKGTLKNVIKQKRGRKPAVKSEPDNSQDKETFPLIPASEIKKEPIDDTTPNSRSSSPKTGGKRQRLTSDKIMMKSVLGDSPSSLVLGPRTSPYSMRSERSNSPSLVETKNLRSGKPRKVKSNLLNEVVMKEQKKRRRLLSDSKTSDAADTNDDCKKLKRGRSCSREGSEISKCSDITESDVSLSETLTDPDGKELNKKVEKPKTDLDLDFENNVQISITDKVPSHDPKLTGKLDTETRCNVNEKSKRNMSLKRSTSLDSDNNNSNRLNIEDLNSFDEDEKLRKTEQDRLIEACSILTSMSKTFNSKEVSKNIRKARRGRKVAAAARLTMSRAPPAAEPVPAAEPARRASATVTAEPAEEKQETLETLSKEIDDLINNLDQNIDRDHEMANESMVEHTDQTQTKSVAKFYGLSKPLGDNNSIVTPETPVKDKDASVTAENTPSKNDDSENIRLHYEEDSLERAVDNSKPEISYKVSTVASIDKLMDRLKVFEEFDKKRQRQESESKSTDSKTVMVTNDVVLIPKSGAHIKQLTDVQSVRSPERPIEKENVLSCFENNSAISIVKRDYQARRSIDIDLPNSVTLIKRNSFSSRKESTSSNHSRDTDAISIFEKSLGKDVTLTEIRKSVDKAAPAPQLDLQHFANLHQNNPTTTLKGVVLDTSQISITPRVFTEFKDIRRSRDSTSRKSSETGIETEEKNPIIEKIKSPPHQVMSPPPLQVKSPLTVQVKSPPPLQVKSPPPLQVKSPPPLQVKSPSPLQVKSPPPLQVNSPPLQVLTLPPQVTSTPAQVMSIPQSTSTPQVTSTPKVTSTPQVTSTPKVTSTAQGTSTAKVTSTPQVTSTPKGTATPQGTSTAKVTSTPQGTSTAKVTSTPQVSLTAKLTSTPQVTSTAKVTSTPQGTSTAKVTSTPQGTSTPQVTSTGKVKSPPKVTSPPVPMPAPVAIKSPEAQPMETEALAPPLENIKPVPADICLPTELPKVDSVKQPEAKLEKTVVPTEKAKIVQPEAMVVEPVEKIEEKVVEKPVEVKEVKEPESKTETPAKSKLSETAELAKPGKSPGKRSKSARNSTENQPGPSNMLNETPESQRRKENVLRTLGLLTHKAAKEAKIQKLKEKQRIYGAGMSGVMSKKSSKGSGDYTGTLKTVIKLNRGAGERDKKKYRSSLKMTFQKSKHRSGKPAPEPGVPPGEDDAYYTIERPAGFAGAGSEGGHRKSYSNRLNNHAETEAAPEPSEPKETLNLVIPEKASSFSIHPGRLCQDQCFYCGGKFGLFDTPCHIAQMKSHERQKKVLDNEERLTIDSCLCDACYRHVDRRANCPSYRKRARPPAQPSRPASPSGSAAGSEAEGAARCHARACAAPAARTIRRKWLIKMRPAVNRLLKLESDYPGLHTLGLCGAHYAALAPLQACALCRRRLTRHHNVHLLHQGHEELNPLLAAAGIPVTLGDKPALCKMCRYYTSLLQRPGHNDKHASSYRRRLLQVYNIEVPAESEQEGEETEADEARRKKPRGKHRRKPSDPDRASSSPGKEPDAQKSSPPLEEDIESLISSNKILVPGAKSADPTPSSDASDPDQLDTENPVIDKQTELQLLLQKQNNPSQFLHNQANLTQKNRNMLKVQNLGIQKPGLQHRINDKNAKRLHKLGQMIVQKDKMTKQDELEAFEQELSPDATMKNISLNEECTIESIPNKKPADINTLKNKWQQSESFTQVKKNLSELSKKLTVEKEPKKTTDAKYSNPVRRLETNPSISVRELFPGEEEMNLQCNIEFGNVKGVTPEGWEKCNTTVQYDVETKKLWTELQRPYGNQSSFLRHLILLEKYFRSGDLVLSHNATPNAANYSDSVQSRLRAYDNVVNDTPRRAEPAISLIEFRKKPAVNGKSLLKTSLSDADMDLKKTMPPPPVFQKPKPKDKKNKPLPPELIAINTPNAQGRKAIQNVLHNIQQLVKGVSASDPTEVAASPLPLGTPRLEGPLQGTRVEGSRVEGSRLEVTRLEAPREKKEHKPDTPKKQKTTSKPWRPTLMPITPENLARVAREPIQTAVDGRRLPSLVKVMSAGQQFHITLHDYNKMCVMRRDKLQQLGHDKPKPDTDAVVTEVQTSAMLGNGGTVVQNIPEKESDLSDLAQIGSNAATILKNVGLKNITIAPITPKTATVTSHTLSPVISTPAPLVTTPMKLQLGPAVSISEAPNLPLISSPMIMPKIPKSLTVIPQNITPQGAVASPQIFSKTDSSRP